MYLVVVELTPDSRFKCSNTSFIVLAESVVSCRFVSYVPVKPVSLVRSIFFKKKNSVKNLWFFFKRRIYLSGHQRGLRYLALRWTLQFGRIKISLLWWGFGATGRIWRKWSLRYGHIHGWISGIRFRPSRFEILNWRTIIRGFSG